MRRTTKKLSGPALSRFLKRVVGEQPGLTPEQAEQVAERLALALSSVRVRALPWPRPRLRKRGPATVSTTAPAAPTPATPTAGPPAPPPKPTPETAPTAAPATQPVAAFDPYAIGLVPTFQREGRDGLIGKLATVTSADDLRKMARAQQIALPEALRQGDVSLDTLRTAIAEGVAKRIADRRAAAG